MYSSSLDPVTATNKIIQNITMLTTKQKCDKFIEIFNLKFYGILCPLLSPQRLPQAREGSRDGEEVLTHHKYG